MKKYIGIIFAVIFTAVIDAQAEKKQLSISPSVSNFEEILHQIKKIPGNDTILVHVNSGLYQLTAPIFIKESLNHPVIIVGDSLNKPIFSGGIQIRNWEETPQGWWKAKIPETVFYGFRFEQLYVNGRRATRARTPDKGWFQLQSVNEVINDKGTGRFPLHGTQKITLDASSLSSLKGLSKKELNDLVAIFYHKWDNTRKPIDYLNIDSGLIITNGTGMKPWNPLSKGTRIVFENYKKALTEAGEWFLDPNDGYLYYIPLPEEKIETTECFAPALECLLKIEGTPNNAIQNIQFKNISFQHTTYLMPKTGNEPQQAAAGISAAISVDFAKNITFDNCEIMHTGNYALWFKKGCQNNKVSHSHLTDLGAGGIKIGETQQKPNENVSAQTHHITIDNNIIQHVGYVFPCAVGVAIFHSSYNTITHNDIADLRYSALSIGWNWGYAPSSANHNVIAYNHLHHIGWGALSDMGAVYTLGVSPGTHIHHNVIHDVYSYDYGGWGLYTDEGSSDIIMENNLVYNCKCGGFHQHYGKENIIRNNIFAWGKLYQVQFTRPEEHLSIEFYHNIILMNQGALFQGNWDKAKMLLDKNCYWDISKKQPLFLGKNIKEWRKETHHDLHSIIANPYFKDAENFNFELKSKKTIRKIGFKPFDYKKAGVYGCDKWKKKAILDNDLKAKFQEVATQKH